MGARARKAPDPAARLARLIGANPMVANRGRGIYRVIVQAMTEVEDPQIQEGLNRHVGKLHEFLLAEVKQRRTRARSASASSPELTAWALIHLGLGFGVLARWVCRVTASMRAGGASATCWKSSCSDRISSAKRARKSLFVCTIFGCACEGGITARR